MGKRDWLNWLCCALIGAFVLAVLCTAFDDDTEYQEYRRAKHDVFMQHNRRDYERDRDRYDERRSDSRGERRSGGLLGLFTGGGDR